MVPKPSNSCPRSPRAVISAILHFPYPLGGVTCYDAASLIASGWSSWAPPSISLAWRRGLSVTIGIAFKCAVEDRFIVTVSDMRVTLDGSIPGVDVGELKDWRLTAHWGLLFAADDLGYIFPIRDRAIDNLSKLPLERHSVAQIQEAVTAAYHSVRTEAAFNKYIRMYGFSSMADFLKTSTSLLGSEITSELLHEIRDFDLRVSLLVYGFDVNNKANVNAGEKMHRRAGVKMHHGRR
jgi:hypothetical protein